MKKRLKSAYLANRLLLASVAGVISLGIALSIKREAKAAFVTASIAMAASYLGVTLVDRRRIEQEKRLQSSFVYHLQELEAKINKLELYETQLYYSLNSATIANQEIEVTVHQLKNERNHLLTQVSDLRQERQDIQQMFVLIYQQKKQLQEELVDLQLQLQRVEQQQVEFNHFFTLVKSEIGLIRQQRDLLKSELDKLKEKITTKFAEWNQLDKNYKCLETNHQQLTIQVSDLYGERESANQNIINLTQLKQQLEADRNRLKNQVRVLGKNREELEQILLDKHQEVEEAKSCLDYLHAEYEQLQSQITDIHNQIDILNAEY